jgi:hypothetical protein
MAPKVNQVCQPTVPRIESSKSSPPEKQDTEALDPEVSHALEPLIEVGCNRERLLHDLRALKLAYELYDKNRPDNALIPRFTFDEHFGFDRKSLKTVLTRMHTCANDVDTLCRKLGSGRVLEIFKMRLSPEQQEAHAEHLAGHNVTPPGFVVPNIPESLRVLASAVDEESK